MHRERERAREVCTGFKETVDEVAEEKEDSRIKEMRVEFLALTAAERLIDSTTSSHRRPIQLREVVREGKVDLR